MLITSLGLMWPDVRSCYIIVTISLDNLNQVEAEICLVNITKHREGEANSDGGVCVVRRNTLFITGGGVRKRLLL